MPPLKLYFFISVIFFFTLALSDPVFFKATKTPNTQGQSINGEAKADSVVKQIPVNDPSVKVTEVPEKDVSVSNSWQKRLNAKVKKASENPEVINATIVQRLPQLMFLMVPVFALFLKMLYLRSDKFYVHHLVFGLHFHSFAFLILLATLLTKLISNKPFGAVLLLTLPVYLYISLKRVYGQSAWRTLPKLLVLLSGYFVIVVISVFVVAFLTIFLYE